jgi:SPASM domain peptide maturase of grasp-with-spasm system
MKSNYFKLFACCIPVKGAERSVICDVQRGEVNLIPNDLLEILIDHSNQNVEQIKTIYGEDNKEVIDEYFDFLIKKEYGFWCDELELRLFPPINLQYETPFHITNVIWDVDESSSFDMESVILELENLGCIDLQVRFFCLTSLDYLLRLCELFENKRVKSIHLILKYNLSIDKDEYVKICKKYLRICAITIHSAPKNESIDLKIDNNTFIAFTQQVISDVSHCGVIDSRYFIANLPLFTEAQKHNTCLNRKISIDVNGEIKNCPSMTKSYGNIKDTTLAQALEKEGFKDMWYIHKDQIEVCKDCEFRYICTDCRAYIQDPNNIYSKPAKCSYNPYTATWGNENPTNNPLYGK